MDIVLNKIDDLALTIKSICHCVFVTDYFSKFHFTIDTRYKLHNISNLSYTILFNTDSAVEKKGVTLSFQSYCIAVEKNRNEIRFIPFK
jgi:hypothetical protein